MQTTTDITEFLSREEEFSRKGIHPLDLQKQIPINDSQLAKLLGLDRSTICGWRTGRREPNRMACHLAYVKLLRWADWQMEGRESSPYLDTRDWEKAEEEAIAGEVTAELCPRCRHADGCEIVRERKEGGQFPRQWTFSERGHGMLAYCENFAAVPGEERACD